MLIKAIKKKLWGSAGVFTRPPKPSVLCFTYRPKGFYWAARCLRQQTVQPHEIIWVCDGISPTEAFGDGTILPRGSRIYELPFPHTVYGGCVPANYGLDRVTGTHLLMLADLSTIGPDWVSGHLEFQHNFPGALVSAGRKDHLPECSPTLESFKGEACDCSGILYPFINEVTIAQEDGGNIFGSSISLPMDLIRKIGGWDERLDGGHGYDDYLFAWRAVAHSGGDPYIVTMDRRVITQRIYHDQEPGFISGVSSHPRTRPDSSNTKIALWIREHELFKPAWRAPREM